MLHDTRVTSVTKRYDDAVPRQTFRFAEGKQTANIIVIINAMGKKQTKGVRLDFQGDYEKYRLLVTPYCLAEMYWRFYIHDFSSEIEAVRSFKTCVNLCQATRLPIAKTVCLTGADKSGGSLWHGTV